MRELLYVLAIIAVIAIIWYLRKQSAQAAEQRKIDEFRRLQAAATAQDQRAALTADAAPGRADAARPAARGGGLLQEAADTAAGREYERATGELDEMTAELAAARRDADREAARIAGRAGEALASVQAAAAAHGGAVPGDGTHNCPSSYPIKGNLSSKLYHVAGQPSYNRTIPEVCFQSVEAAKAAGFYPARDVVGARGTGVMAETIVDEEVIVIDDGDGGDVVAEAIAAADVGGVPPGAVRGDGSRECPPTYPIKGNASSMLYHLPSSQTYLSTIPEFCFSSVEAAETAGFSATRR